MRKHQGFSLVAYGVARRVGLRAIAAMLSAVMLTASGFSAIAAQAPADEAQRYAELQSFSNGLGGHTSIERSALIAARYRETYRRQDYSRASLRKASDSDLEFRYRAAKLAAFYTLEPHAIADMAGAYRQLASRNLAGPAHAKALYDIYVAARMFPEARAFGAGHADVADADLPSGKLADSREPTAWTLFSGRPVRVTVDTADQAMIVVVSHPDCRFSARAARDIAQDPRLSALLKHDAVWLMPQDGEFDLGLLARWQAAHPDARSMMMHKRTEWPWLHTWETPTFYFLKHGRVVRTVVGWPRPEGRKQELLAGLEAIGL